MRTIPHAAAHLSEAHYRARHPKTRGKFPFRGSGAIYLFARVVIGAAILVGLIVGVHAVMQNLVN